MTTIQIQFPISNDTEINRKLTINEATAYLNQLRRFAEKKLAEIEAIEDTELDVIESGALENSDVIKQAKCKHVVGCTRALEIAMKERFPQRKYKLTILKYVAEKMIDGGYEAEKEAAEAEYADQIEPQTLGEALLQRYGQTEE